MRILAAWMKAERYGMLCRDVSLLLDQSWGVKGPSAQEPGPSSGAGSGSESEGSEEDVSIV